ncbi:MAG: hypothetical protein K2Q06_11160 [Parvularculaceae bacterium]|nr:hypothetical protein [Parvularculaceae bacterium]
MLSKLINALALAAAAAAACACTPLTLSWAKMSGKGDAAAPPLFAEMGGSAPTVEAWERTERPRLLALFEDNVYGALPDASEARVVSQVVLDEAAFGGLGRLEEYRIEAKASFDGVVASTETLAPGGFVVDLLTPAGAGRHPVILMETFCPRWNTIPHPKVSRPADAKPEMAGPMASVANYVFGRYICTPPVEEILKRGYGIAAIFPSEVVPDESKAGLAALAALSAGHKEAETRWGAIAAWSWIFSRAIDAIGSNDHVDPDALVVWGHSRYGKAALLAAAVDRRIDAVVAHQSGTGGASLSKRKKGESVKGITSQYPHWFAEAYARYAGREEDLPIDQHQLLALVAPTPILLGNARRDVWSDPNGAFRAAKGADPAYKLYGSKGLTQATLAGFDPDADLAFWIRPGTHGVVKEDWPAFLAFLDAHFEGGAR